MCHGPDKHPDRKPIEKPPTGVTLPIAWHARQNGGKPYRVKDGDSWETLAKRFMISPSELIYFNFMTHDPAVVNHYLRTFVGCVCKSPSGFNWSFSSRANPGVIFIPPPPIEPPEPIVMEPENVTGWTQDSGAKLLVRLKVVAQTIPGNRGDRIRKLVNVMVKEGYPECRYLWYYNSAPIMKYVSFHTKDSERVEMTRATNGKFPFEGSAGPAFGDWMATPFDDLMTNHPQEAANSDFLKQYLLFVDDQMYQGWYQLTLVDAQSSQGGGSGFGDKVDTFLQQMKYVSELDGHLYSAFGK